MSFIYDYACAKNIKEKTKKYLKYFFDEFSDEEKNYFKENQKFYFDISEWENKPDDCIRKIGDEIGSVAIIYQEIGSLKFYHYKVQFPKHLEEMCSKNIKFIVCRELGRLFNLMIEESNHHKYDKLHFNKLAIEFTEKYKTEPTNLSLADKNRCKEFVLKPKKLIPAWSVI